ncbi:MAG: MBL fold metallo-hydrolase [Chlamydiae bacterium]|nr:MBL fold metallo-hydrolase [Chlamydiota bacterium]
MIGICPLASGSRGNAIYLGFKNTKILIDGGISYFQLKTRLLEIGVDISEIDAVLVSHEHANKMLRFKIFTTGESFEFKDLTVFPFSVPHDTLDPVGFVIKVDGLKLGFCTDLGFVSSLVKKCLEGVDYLYIEANHEVSMVHSCNRPMVYKQRVLSRQGHISNEQCLNLIQDLIHPNLKHIFLAHLSQECNSKELLKSLIEKLLKEKKSSARFSIAYQEKVSDKVLF